MLPEMTWLAGVIEADIVARHRTPDTVVELGTLTLRRRWAPGLARLADRVPASGRLVVDALSGDHLRAVSVRAGADLPRRRRARRPRGLVSPAELVAAADTAGLAIVDVVPYGALLGGPQAGLSHLSGLERTHGWRRALSWLPEDPALVDLVLFLERTIVAGLPTVATHRMMIVLERRRDPDANGSWLREHDAAVERWRRDAATTAEAMLTDDLRSELDTLLEPSHARYVGFSLLAAVQQLLPAVGAAAFLRGERAGQYAAWRRAVAIDAAATRWMRDWSAGLPNRLVRGVDTSLATDYRLVGELLDEHLRLFEGGR